MTPPPSFRLLLVEDDALQVRMTKRILEGRGHRVVATAGDVRSALTSIAEGELDGAVVDLDLQGHSSLEVQEALLERGIPQILVTGHGVLPREGRSSSVVASPDLPVLGKPVDWEVLLRRIEAFSVPGR